MVAANINMLRECDKELAVPTDHPGFLLDIDLDFMLQRERTDLRVYPTRGITSSNAKTRNALNETLHKACLQGEIYKTIGKISWAVKAGSRKRNG